MSDAPSESKKPTAATHISVSRVAWIVVPVVLLLAAAVVFFGVFDGWKQIQRLFRPPLVQVTGEVFYQGKPLQNGQILTQPTQAGLRGSVGFITEGKFTLQMDIEGKFVDGAYAGEHKVTVADYAMQQGPSPPQLLTPQRYAAFASTPLVMNVSKDATQNQWKITLEDAPEDETADAGGRPGGGGPPGPSGGGGPRRGGPPMSVDMMLGTMDENENGALDAEELESAPQRLKDLLQNADQNGDAKIDRSELEQAVAAANNPAPASGSAAPQTKDTQDNETPP